MKLYNLIMGLLFYGGALANSLLSFYTFLIIKTEGQIIYAEPTKLILYIELFVSAIIVLLTLYFSTKFVIKTTKEEQ